MARRSRAGAGGVRAGARGRGSARADRVDEAWRRGNEAYLHGDYAAAVAAYEEVDRQGAVVGRRRVQPRRRVLPQGRAGAGDLGVRAGARRSIPNDDDARYNLDKARKLAARRAHDRMEGEDKDPAWMRARRRAVAPSTATWFFVALYLGVLRGADRAPPGARRVRGRR